MVQNAIKILTLGFFISMITGFVMYRSGYFDSADTSYALQTSPNGGELNSVNIDQDSTKSPEINQQNQAPIMPSSKSSVPIFDLDESIKSVERTMKKEILPSSKSILHPIQISPESSTAKRKMMSSSKSIIISEPSVSTLSNQEAIKVQPELELKDSTTDIDDSDKSSETEIKGANRKTTSETKTTRINWRGIWIGVLGILFVAIGSIVYFKRRSK